MVATRDVYGATLAELGRENPNIVVLDADLALSTKTFRFGKEFPDRFFYVGICEANMMGLAAGLALAGKLPFVSTFAVFATSRSFDQLRQSIAMARLNVKVVATHGGITVGEDGSTHHAIEDLGLACSLPGFTVVVPADANITAPAIRAVARHPGPAYVRLTRSEMPDIYPPEPPFELGRAITLRDGGDVTIIACGRGVSIALEAAALLDQRGVSCRVLDMHTLAPIDADAIEEAARETGAVVTVEEHLAQGGLGSIVARVLGERCPVPLRVVALSQYSCSGKPDQLLAAAGLTPENVALAAEQTVARKLATLARA